MMNEKKNTSKTQKRPPDYGKPDRAGEAIASYYDGGNYSWNQWDIYVRSS